MSPNGFALGPQKPQNGPGLITGPCCYQRGIVAVGYTCSSSFCWCLLLTPMAVASDSICIRNCNHVRQLSGVRGESLACACRVCVACPFVNQPSVNQPVHPEGLASSLRRVKGFSEGRKPGKGTRVLENGNGSGAV